MTDKEKEKSEESKETKQDEAEAEQKSSELNFEGHVTMGDVRMTSKDFQTLYERGKLEDNVILFFIEYLRAVLFPDHKNEIEILGPSIVEFLKNIHSYPLEEELLENIKPLKLMTKKVVLAVIHNPKAEHWSLLVYIPNGNFYHLDSLNSVNNEVAKAFASRLMHALNLKDSEFIEKPSSKQDNSYDCGLFVIASSQKTLEHIISDGKPMSEDFKNPVQLESQEKRKELLKIVQALSKQKS